jgi:hypothetical protein
MLKASINQELVLLFFQVSSHFEEWQVFFIYDIATDKSMFRDFFYGGYFKRYRTGTIPKPSSPAWDRRLLDNKKEKNVPNL